MSKKTREDFVPASVCSLRMDAQDAKIDANKTLMETEIKAFKTAVYASVTTATTILAALEIFLRFWHP